MLSEGNSETSVEELDTSSSIRPTNIHKDAFPLLTLAAVPGSSMDLKEKFYPIKKLSNNDISKAIVVLHKTPSDTCCSTLVDENISSQDSVLNPLPSTSSQILHLQDTASGSSLKHSHSPLNPNISDDEPMKKKLKIVHLEIAGSPKNTLYCENSNPSENAKDNISPIDFNEMIIDCAEENNSKELDHLKTIPISELAVEQRCQFNSRLENPTSPSDAASSNLCDEKNPGKNYFVCLPFPIIENIFCRLPFLNLMKSSSVCKMWNELITEPKFLEWKKAYYNVKLKHYELECWSIALSYFSARNLCTRNCFSVLISFMDTKFKKKPPHGLDMFLDRIPSCVIAKRLLLERFSEKPLLCANPWCILALTVILSSTIEDLYEVFNRLINVYHCDYIIIIEAMFCIATILLYFIKECSINHGMHYRLFHVIYLFENKLPVYPVVSSLELEKTILQGQQNLQECCQSPVPNMTLTYEQIEILNHKLAPNQIVKIFAPAGTGKTTTLLLFAKKHPNLKFLYIPSRELCHGYAASRFPSNVDCKTVYSMAYGLVGKLYVHKLKDELKAGDILPFVHNWEALYQSRFLYAESILNTIDRFIDSSDAFITPAHVQSYVPNLGDSLHLYNQADSCTVDKDKLFQLVVLNEAQELWKKMKSKNNADCQITPDIYLKIFLSCCHPLFQRYNCIMIDQAEDFNAMMLKYILSLKVPIILAGDSNQKIGNTHFRNDPWPDIPITHTYYLTKSFRFGHKIAYVANCCSEVLTYRIKSTLIGTLEESYVDGTIKGQYAVIARTNKALFLEAVRLCCTSERRPNEPQAVRGAFAEGMSSYEFDQMADIFKLKCKQSKNNIKCSFIRQFDSFFMLERHAHYKDKDLYGRICLVNKYGAKINDYMNIIKQKCSFKLAEADVVFSTVQHVKGLEFDTVRLTDDFCQANISDHPPFLFAQCMNEIFGGIILKDDHNNIYTAVTRAKTCLVMPEHLYLTLLQAQEEFQYLAESSAILNDSESLQCVLCLTTFVPSTLLIMVCRTIILSSGSQEQGGPFCKECSINLNYRYDINFGPLSRIKNHYNISMAGFLE